MVCVVDDDIPLVQTTPLDQFFWRLYLPLGVST